MSGKKNSFTASLYHEGKDHQPLYIIDGQWTSEFTIKDVNTKSIVAAWNHKAQKTTPLIVAPIEQQDELESRRAWKKVADAIAKGDMNVTSYEKSLIETSQRNLRRQEKEEEREWDRVFFSRVDKTPHFDDLAKRIGESLEIEKTNGAWRYDEEKAQKATIPYRPGALSRVNTAT